MLPDERHGTVAGYNRIPCREKCCKDAMAKYKSMRELDLMAGKPRIIDATGTQRRIRALSCLGWSNAEVARRAGMHPEHLPRLVKGAVTINRRTAERIAKVYEELSMELPAGRTKQEKQAISYARNTAKRRGYLPPLAWDEDKIDDPNFTPKRTQTREMLIRKDIDPVVVERVLAGDMYLHTTPAERREISRRWVQSGRSGFELAARTGWKVERYYKQSEGAA